MSSRILFIALSSAVFLSSACPKQQEVETGPPPVGWTEIGSAQCYNPSDFASEPNELKRKEMRQITWDQLRRGFGGEIEGHPAMKPERLESLELVLLGYPDRIEGFSLAAFKRCAAVGEGGSSDEYVSWLNASSNRLSEDDCNRAFMFEVHDEIKVQAGWQLRYHMCKGDKIRIDVASGAQLYTVYDTGSIDKNTYYGILGDPSAPPSPTAPCQQCRAGELLLRFEPDDGGSKVEPFYPVPPDTDLAAKYQEMKDAGERFTIEFLAAEHGYISVGINDDTYYDNIFFENVTRGFVEYVPIDIYPVIGEGEMYLGN